MALYEFENQHFDYAMWGGEPYFQCFEDGEYLSYTANGTVNDALWEYMQENSIEIRPMRPDYHTWNGNEWVLDETAFFAAKKVEYESAVEQHLDTVAQEYGYNTIYTALSYIGSSNTKWAVEAVALRDWRDSVWLTTHTILNDVVAEIRPLPSIEAVIAELPEYEQPDEQP